MHYIVEPVALWLTWQHPDESAPDRTRRAVGLLTLEPSGAPAFRYLKGTDDFEAARAAGFRGFPSFSIDGPGEHRIGAIEPFLQRLPPPKREDFRAYLAQHGLQGFRGSVFALLGYTGARLPSDGFALMPIFVDNGQPIDYITELAGTRYVFQGDIAQVAVGDAVRFELDPSNAVDPNAVVVLWRGQRLGFINRVMRTAFNQWLGERVVTATIGRVDGRPQRPLVYVRVEIR